MNSSYLNLEIGGLSSNVTCLLELKKILMHIFKHKEY